MRERHKEGDFGRGTEGGGASTRPRLCSLTLEGIVIGLDALTDGLLQVPLLYTLDPQVLEAESPPGMSPIVSAQPAPPSSTHSPDHHSASPPRMASSCAAKRPTPYLGRQALVPCVLALATAPAGPLPSAAVAFFCSPNTLNSPFTSRPVHLFTLLGLFFPCFSALSHYSSLN